jgi:hypothetical protein
MGFSMPTNLSTSNQRAATFAPILGFAVIFRFQFLKIGAFHTIDLIALRAVSACNFCFLKGQMTMPATKFVVLGDDQEEVLMFALGHWGDYYQIIKTSVNSIHEPCIDNL